MIALALVMFTGAQVSAAEVKISGQPLSFEAPDGYCILQKNNPFENLAINVTRKLIGPAEIAVWFFYDCAEKDRLLKGEISGVSHTGAVIVTKRKAFVDAAAQMTRAEYIAALSHAHPWQAMAKAEDQRLKNLGLRVKTSKVKEIGKDEFAVYVAGTQSMYVGRRWVTFVSVSAETVINRLPVTIGLSWEDGGEGSLKPLLQEVRALARDTIARNEGGWIEEPPAKDERRAGSVASKPAVFLQDSSQ